MTPDEEAARVRDLAFELLATLETVAGYEYAMEQVFSSALRARIRTILKEVHGE